MLHSKIGVIYFNCNLFKLIIFQLNIWSSFVERMCVRTYVVIRHSNLKSIEAQPFKYKETFEQSVLQSRIYNKQFVCNPWKFFSLKKRK